MKSKFITFTLSTIFLSALALYSCQQETITTDTASSLSEQSKTRHLQRLMSDSNLDAQAMTFTGGNVETVVDEIEDALNEEYAIPMQSVTNVAYDRNEMIISAPSGYINETQAQNIYNSVLNHWADTYDSVNANNKDALGAHIDVVTQTNGNVKLIIDTWAAEESESGSLSPCDNLEVPEGVYLCSESSAAFFPDYTKFADVEVEKLLNKKVTKDNCKYLTETQSFLIQPFTNISLEFDKSGVEKLYCDALKRIEAELAKNSNFVLGSVSFFGTPMTTSPGGLNHFRISFTIGVLKTRVNCIPPEKAPIRGGF